jgi:hypothetical protein
VNKYLRNLAIAVALAFTVAVILTPGHKTGRQQPEKRNPSDEMVRISPTVAPNSLDRNRRIPLPNDNAAAQSQAGEADPDMIGVKESLRSYRNAFGENPIGTNAEIARALTGGNPRQAKFADGEVRIKAGQMVDRWDHPYFFHQLSRTEMEIRSAGPDGVMWTKDDEVLR